MLSRDVRQMCQVRGHGRERVALPEPLCRNLTGRCVDSRSDSADGGSFAHPGER